MHKGTAPDFPIALARGGRGSVSAADASREGGDGGAFGAHASVL